MPRYQALPRRMLRANYDLDWFEQPTTITVHEDNDPIDTGLVDSVGMRSTACLIRSRAGSWRVKNDR